MRASVAPSSTRSGPGAGGGSGPAGSTRISLASSSARGDDSDPIPVQAGAPGPGEFIAPIPRATGDVYSAYVLFSAAFGTPIGTLPSFLLPGALAAAGGTAAGTSGGSGGSGTADAEAASGQEKGGTLGAAVRSLTPTGDSSPGSALWWLYAGLAALLTGLAATFVFRFARRFSFPRIP